MKTACCVFALLVISAPAALASAACAAGNLGYSAAPAAVVASICGATAAPGRSPRLVPLPPRRPTDLSLRSRR